MMAERAHALLSASSAHRWLNCTAAPQYEQQFPDTTSEYAAEGTIAHEICEIYVLRKFGINIDRKALSRRMSQLKHDKLYSDEMLQTAQIYVDHLTEKAMTFDAVPYVAAEVKVDLSEWVPQGFGTCDCVMIGSGKLHITDYKHGRGVRVEAVGNPQMRLYALGALKMFSAIYDIKTVSMSICQPRISEFCPEEEMSVEDLRAWGESIKPVAALAYSGNGSYAPGEWCRFCKGRNVCKARADFNSALADFKDCVPAEKATPETPAANILSDEQVGVLLELGSELVTWYNGLCEYAQQKLLNGGTIKGYKLVAGKSARAFKDPDRALDVLRDAGYGDDDLLDTKIKSLASIEKFIGKKKFSELLAEEVVQPPGKPTLVPELDKRPAYNPAASDFEGVVK